MQKRHGIEGEINMIDEKKLIEEIEDRLGDWEDAAGEYRRIGDEEGVAIYERRAVELKVVLKKIQKQPKVGEWIPCSERLPKEARAVEVTMYDGNRAIGHFYNRLDTWFDSINGGFIDVIAWKEPSEPWEGGKD